LPFRVCQAGTQICTLKINPLDRLVIGAARRAEELLCKLEILWGESDSDLVTA
jgi:hypothetical protein